MLEEIGYSIGMIEILRKNKKEDIQKHAYYKRQLKEDIKVLRELKKDIDNASMCFSLSKCGKDEEYIEACMSDNFTELLEKHKDN